MLLYTALRVAVAPLIWFILHNTLSLTCLSLEINNSQYNLLHQKADYIWDSDTFYQAPGISRHHVYD